MSLLDDVSIVVTPNGYKAGELYAVKPNNGDADMDVTRATAATRVDEDGLVNYADIIGDEEVTNGDFATDTDWTKGTGWSISGGTASHTGGASYLSQDILQVDTLYKVNISVTAVSGGGFVQIYMGNSPASVLISTIGDYTYYFTSQSSVTLGFALRSLGDITIDNVSVKQVDRDNVPRIDYTGGGCPHILAEPQRTNIVTYSEKYGSGTFFIGTSGSTIDNTTNISPSGDANATQLTSTGAGKLQSGGLGLTQNTDYVLSFYAKNVDATLVNSRVLGLGGSEGENLTSVDYTSQLSTTEWTRITHIFNTGTNTTIYVYLSSALNSGGTIQLWGAQLEEGSYATSYIPTSGSTVTRNQDIFTRDGIGSLINSTEGVLFVEMAALSNDGTNRFLFISDGTNDNGVRLYYSTTSNQIISRYYVSGIATAIISFTLSNAVNFNKIAFKWRLNDFALWVNGVEVGTDFSGAVLSSDTLNNISLTTGVGSSPFFSKVRQLQVYTTALSDDQIKQITQ